MPHVDRPNILVLCTDQHRFDALGSYGNPVIQTPVIDKLAEDGATFERCYTPSLVCAPARASMLTGKYPHSHGLWANGVALPRRNELLGRLLTDEGYDCGVVGKLHFATCKDDRTEERFDDGFRVYTWSISPSHPSPDNRYHHWVKANFPELWAKQRDAPPSTGAPSGHSLLPYEDMPTEAHYSRWIADETIQFLREDRDSKQPFFFMANFLDPHHPFVAPPEYLDQYRGRELPTPIRPPRPEDDKPPIQTDLSAGRAGPPPGVLAYSESDIQEIIAAYYAMISLIDDEVGRVLQVLDEMQLADNTLVILTSDHGEMLGDHAQILKGPLFYEGAARVPLILRWPRHIPAGSRPRQLVGTLDIFATCLSAAGLPQPAESQAVDLLPLAAGSSSADARQWALCEYRNSGFPIEPPVHATMIRDDRYKLVVHHGGERPRFGELYDLEVDPDETVNRWNRTEYADVRREMTELLLDVLVETENRSAVREGPW